jgi:hypothetical protein
MPDIFGLPTPQELQEQATLKQESLIQANKDRFAALQASTNGAGRGGLAIGNALGGLFRKERGPAKAVDPLQEAKGVAQSVFEQQAPVIGSEKARAQAMRVMSIQLRHNGMDDDATRLTIQADQIDQAEDIRLRGVADAKVASAQARATLENTGEDAFTNRTQRIESLHAQIATAESEADALPLERMLGAELAKQAHDIFISESDADERRRLSGSGLNKLSEDYIDSKLLDGRLEKLENTLIEQKGSLAATTVGRFGAGTAAFMENTFGLDPASIGADTLIGDVTEIAGSSAFVSAEIRHALTGAAMSPAEAVFLQPFLATPGESLSKNLAKVRVIRQFTQLDIAARQALLENPDSLGKSWLADAEAGAIRNFKNEQSSVAPDLDADVSSALSRSAQLRKQAQERRRARN